MTSVLMFLLVFLLGLVSGGALVVFLLRKREADARTQIEEKFAAQLATRDGELVALREEKSALAIRRAELETELAAERTLFAERQATLEAARDSFADAFKVISADALEKNNQTFMELARATLESQQAATQAAAKADLE